MVSTLIFQSDGRPIVLVYCIFHIFMHQRLSFALNFLFTYLLMKLTVFHDLTPGNNQYVCIGAKFVEFTYTFYRAMHFSAYARSWDRMSSVCPSVRLSVTLVDCDHITWKSWKLIARTISPTPSLFVAKRRSTYSQGNVGKFGED